jgi:hypothetical protein
LGAPAQMVAAPPNQACKVSSTLTVTVSDKSGAVIPNAFVLLIRSALSSAPQLSELRTDAEGRATASVGCGGYVDVFATAAGWDSNAKKVLVENEKQFVAISLDVFPMTQY